MNLGFDNCAKKTMLACLFISSLNGLGALS